LLAGLSGALCLLTLVAPDWIELLVGVDPDAGSGALEWGIVGALAAVALACAIAARFERRRLHSRPA